MLKFNRSDRSPFWLLKLNNAALDLPREPRISDPAEERSRHGEVQEMVFDFLTGSGAGFRLISANSNGVSLPSFDQNKVVGPTRPIHERERAKLMSWMSSIRAYVMLTTVGAS
jgi:hypothetical protein